LLLFKLNSLRPVPCKTLIFCAILKRGTKSVQDWRKGRFSFDWRWNKGLDKTRNADWNFI